MFEGLRKGIHLVCEDLPDLWCTTFRYGIGEGLDDG